MHGHLELAYWVLALILAAGIITGMSKSSKQQISTGEKMSVGQTMTLLACIATVLFSFFGGFLAFMELSRRASSVFALIGVPIGMWAGGLLLAALVWHFSRDRKNSPPPGA